MQDGSHKLLFLGLSCLMSVACFYGSQTGPMLLVGNDAMPAVESIVFTPRGEHDPLMTTAPSGAPIAAKLAPDGACPAETSEKSPLCLATSKVSLSSR